MGADFSAGSGLRVRECRDGRVQPGQRAGADQPGAPAGDGGAEVSFSGAESGDRVERAELLLPVWERGGDADRGGGPGAVVQVFSVGTAENRAAVGCPLRVSSGDTA